ncbi:hypothetical protein U9M48_040835 [Paspalum notatum var. saurae]|uniref:Uncharacterized protein n=1 Tax=Paspalum notatum var. saurae TaxID=547442 RepID=A0AAQ3UMP2_PASNO
MSKLVLPCRPTPLRSPKPSARSTSPPPTAMASSPPPALLSLRRALRTRDLGGHGEVEVAAISFLLAAAAPLAVIAGPRMGTRPGGRREEEERRGDGGHEEEQQTRRRQARGGRERGDGSREEKQQARRRRPRGGGGRHGEIQRAWGDGKKKVEVWLCCGMWQPNTI